MRSAFAAENVEDGMKYSLVAVAVSVVCGGCSLATETPAEFDDVSSDGDVGLQTAAIGEPKCSSGAYNKFVIGTPALFIQGGYDNAECDMAYVVRLLSYEAAPNKALTLSYAGLTVANPLVCDQIRVRMDVYKYSSGVGTLKASKVSWGVWSTDRCVFTPVKYVPAESGTYQIVVQSVREVNPPPPTYSVILNVTNP
jgi:hypothetical protein